MSWVTWDYRCETCDHIETHMQKRNDVPDYEYCCAEGCDGQAYKMYGGNVNTSKTSKTIPAGTSNRLGKIKTALSAKKALSMAKQTGDAEGANSIRKEIAKINTSKS